MNIAVIGSTHERPTRPVGLLSLQSVGELNVEMLTANPLLQTDRKSAIRFSASGTVTIVLGIRDYGRGLYSAHFASLVATRLGLPLRRMRVYYSATLPAVLQTPQDSGTLPERSRLGPLATAVGKLIDDMCGRVVENGRAIFAELTEAATVDSPDVPQRKSDPREPGLVDELNSLDSALLLVKGHQRIAVITIPWHLSD